MFDPFDKIAVPTTAGTYVIALYYDIDAAAPDYSDDGGFVYLGAGSHHHAGAAFRQADADGSADTAAAAGDYRDFPL